MGCFKLNTPGKTGSTKLYTPGKTGAPHQQLPVDPEFCVAEFVQRLGSCSKVRPASNFSRARRIDFVTEVRDTLRVVGWDNAGPC